MPALNSRPTSSSAEAQVEQHVGLGRGAGRGEDRRQVDRVGVAVEQRQTVEEERRGERAEQEVLHRGLLRQQPPAPGHAGHQVQRQRQHLERDEHEQQVVRRPGRSACRETANSISGKTSVCTRSVRDSRRSAGEPTDRGAEATIALPESTLRSAISRAAMSASTRMVPCRNRPVPSMASEPANGLSEPVGDGVAMCVPCSRPTATSAATQPGERDDDLRCEPLRARHHRLDEHAHQRRAEHDEDRRQRVVGDRRRRRVVGVGARQPAHAGCRGSS